MPEAAAHTPGPWHQCGAFWGNIWSADCKVAVCADVRQATNYREAGEDERKANACLIAASPELLAALRELHEAVIALAEMSADKVTYFEASPSRDPEAHRRWLALNDAQAKARAAIAKAEGPHA